MKLTGIGTLAVIGFTGYTLSAGTYFLQSLGGADGSPPWPFNPDPGARLTEISPGVYIVNDTGEISLSSGGSMFAADDYSGTLDPTGSENDSTNAAPNDSGATNCPCCLYPTNAVLKWYLHMPNQCFYADPTIGLDGTLYVPCYGMTLVALNPGLVDTNDPLYPLPDDFTRWSISASDASTPLVGNDGVVYANTAPNVLSAIDPTDGNIIWSFHAPPSQLVVPALNVQPAIGTDGTIYLPAQYYVIALTNAPGVTNFYSDTNLYPYELTNVWIKWIYIGDTNEPQGTFTYSSPAVGGNGTIYIDAYPGYLYALNPTNGALIWRTAEADGSVPVGPAIGGDGIVYYSSYNALYAVDPDLPVTNQVSGGVTNPVLAGYKWKIKVPPNGSGSYGSIFPNPPAISGDKKLYIRTIFLTSGTTNLLLCLNPADGTTNWSANLGPIVDNGNGEWTRGDIALGSDGEIFVVDDDGEVFSFCPNGTLNWRYQTFNSGLQAPMIGADGTLYTICDNRGGETPYLYAFQSPTIACAPWPEDGKNARHSASVMPPATAGHLSAPAVVTNGFQFTVNAPTNAVECLCATTNLTSGEWTNVAQVVLTNGPQNVIDATMTNYPCRFYAPFRQ